MVQTLRWYRETARRQARALARGENRAYAIYHQDLLRAISQERASSLSAIGAVIALKK